jgi:hypothetical protein
MATPADAQDEVFAALKEHFDRTHDHLEVPQIVDMTALDENTVQQALRVLYQQGAIEGITAAEIPYPFHVTGIKYH